MLYSFLAIFCCFKLNSIIQWWITVNRFSKSINDAFEFRHFNSHFSLQNSVLNTERILPFWQIFTTCVSDGQTCVKCWVCVASLQMCWGWWLSLLLALTSGLLPVANMLQPTCESTVWKPASRGKQQTEYCKYSCDLRSLRKHRCSFLVTRVFVP